MARTVKDLVGASLFTWRDWVITAVAPDGTATLQSRFAAARTLTAGDFTGPDPTASPAVEVIEVPVTLLWDAIECGPIEMEPAVPHAEAHQDADVSVTKQPRAFGAILCADWSKGARGRAVYIGLPGTRTIQRIDHAWWTLDELLDTASRYSPLGPVLVAVDAPIGVPKSFVPRRPPDFEFTRWLKTAAEHPGFFTVCGELDDWGPHRPFFGIQGGDGGRDRWVERMRAHGVEPLREIDRRTGAKPLFIVNGIPGAVGHAAQDISKSILKNRRRLSVWPFDGPLSELAVPDRPTLAEMYPRAMYGIALGDGPVDKRFRLFIHKNCPHCRAAALESLAQQPWVQRFEVQIRDRDYALQSGDDFDALMSAAAVLRCLLEGSPLESAYRDPIEGGILASLSLNIHLRENRVPCDHSVRDKGPVHTNRRSAPLRSLTFSARPCPIPGCAHVYRNGRGGWDARVASLRTHPDWHPEAKVGEARKRLFRQEYPDFFKD